MDVALADGSSVVPVVLLSVPSFVMPPSSVDTIVFCSACTSSRLALSSSWISAGLSSMWTSTSVGACVYEAQLDLLDVFCRYNNGCDRCKPTGCFPSSPHYTPILLTPCAGTDALCMVVGVSPLDVSWPLPVELLSGVAVFCSTCWLSHLVVPSFSVLMNACIDDRSLSRRRCSSSRRLSAETIAASSLVSAFVSY